MGFLRSRNYNADTFLVSVVPRKFTRLGLLDAGVYQQLDRRIYAKEEKKGKRSAI